MNGSAAASALHPGVFSLNSIFAEILRDHAFQFMESVSYYYLARVLNINGGPRRRCFKRPKRQVTRAPDKISQDSRYLSFMHGGTNGKCDSIARRPIPHSHPRLNLVIMYYVGLFSPG